MKRRLGIASLLEIALALAARVALASALTAVSGGLAGCRGDPAGRPPDLVSGSHRADSPPEPGPGDEPASSVAEPEAPRTYLGREIAATMSHLGADWLVRPERQAEEDTDLLHRRLGLQPGDVACDFGAGNGYHTVRMAQAVAPSGRAVAIDLQPEMLELLRERASAAGLDNVQLVTAAPDDPRVPQRTCDLVLLVDVYHELQDPAAVLAHLRRALTPSGRIALVEFRAEDPAVPIKPLHKMTKAQILRELEANGFRVVAEFDGLPWQHLMFFAPA